MSKPLNLHLILFLFSYLFLHVSFATDEHKQNPFTPKASLIRYWNTHISNNLPQPTFLISKASPLNAVDTAFFTKLASENTLNTRLSTFCSAANLFCDFDTSLQTHRRPLTPPHKDDANFASYNNKQFTTYGGSRVGGADTFKNYSDNINMPVNSFTRYSPNTAGHGERFTSYSDNGNVANDSFSSYGAGATGGLGEFKSYESNVNVPNLKFSSYSSNGNNHKQSFSSYTENTGQSTSHFDLDVVLYSTEHQTEKIGEEAVKVACISSDKIVNPVISDHQEQENLEEVSLNSNGQCFNVSEMDSDHFVNHVQINDTSEEFDKLLAEGSPECENLKAGEESESTGTQETNSTLSTEVVQVETFPLRPTTEETNDLRSISSESGKFDCNLNDLVAEKVKLSNSTLVLGKDISSDNSSDLMTIKREEHFEVSASGGSHDMIIQHAEVNHMVVQHREDNLKIDSIDMPDSVPSKDDTVFHHDRVNQVPPHDDSTLKTAEPNNLQPKTASKGTSCLENINDSSGKNFKEPTVVTGNDSKRDGKPIVGSSPLLDRIDLESWKASKKEGNPLLTIFKAFVDAFVRFWSE